MKNKIQTLTLLLSLVCLSNPSQADSQYRCPKVVAGISHHSLTQLLLPIFKDVYQALGCQTKFLLLPGKRGLAEFNGGHIDGELVRLETATQRYKRPFIRSAVQTLDVKGSLWVNPDKSIAKERPVGFSRGIVWQEKQMKKDIRGAIFNSMEAVFEAYNRGSIGSFLYSDEAVALGIAQNSFTVNPIRKKVLLEAPVFHFLKAEFAPFMAAYDQYVAENDSYASVRALLN